MAVPVPVIFPHLKGTSRPLTGAQPIDVAIVDASGSQITSFGGSGGTSDADGSTHTAGVTLGAPIQGLYESAPTSVADGKVGTVGMTTDRKLKVSGTFSSTPITSATSALSNVPDSASSVTVLASNANRLNFALYNDSTSAVCVKLGASASATSFTKKLLPREEWTTSDLGVNWTGIIDAIWDTAPGGAMRVTELSA